jgi:hypothetical protein
MRLLNALQNLERLSKCVRKVSLSERKVNWHSVLNGQNQVGSIWKVCVTCETHHRLNGCQIINGTGWCCEVCEKGSYSSEVFRGSYLRFVL